jgi:proteasome assembly chaperone (PAC2) family protein
LCGGDFVLGEYANDVVLQNAADINNPASRSNSHYLGQGVFMNLKRVAELIANDLFVNGNNEEAERLVLMSADKRDIGGWGKRAVVSRILDILKEELK